MITGFALMCLNVLDQDESKAFYVDMLGFEVAMDEVTDGFRFLVLSIPGQPQTPLMLVEPGPPTLDPLTAEAFREHVARGRLSIGALATNDCRATYEQLRAKGVEFTEEPHERFYGIDAAFRDPSGNYWRLTETRT